MSRRTPTSAAVVLLHAAVLICGGCADPATFAALQTGIAVAPAAITVDRLWGGTQLQHFVTISNTGAVPLTLSVAARDVEAPLRVTTALAAEGLAPGDTTFVTATLAADDGESALSHATIVIDTDVGATAEVRITASILAQPDCDDDDACTRDAFVAELGACRHDAVPDLTPCDDDDACTTDDRCLAGECVAAPISCDDGVECTVDACDAQTGCENVSVDARCDDGDPCTADTCGAQGCSNGGLPDGTLCLFDGCTSIGVCLLGDCRVQPTPDGVPCEDGDPCTIQDVCLSGECAAGTETELGAAPPYIVDGEATADLCLGDDPWACAPTYVQTTMEEVLAVEAAGDGVRVVWRAPLVDLYGNACPQGVIANRRAGAALDAPNNARCGAPIMQTMITQSGFGLASATTQLTTARGVAAASISRSLTAAPGFAVVVAYADPLRGVLVVEAFSDDGTHQQLFLSWPGTYPTEAPFALAVGASPQGAVVATQSTGVCQVCDDCDSIGCYAVVDADLYVDVVANVGGSLTSARTAVLLAVPSTCDETVFSPLRIDDLEAALQGADVEVTFRGPHDLCGDAVDAPYALRFTADPALLQGAPEADPAQPPPPPQPPQPLFLAPIAAWSPPAAPGVVAMSAFPFGDVVLVRALGGGCLCPADAPTCPCASIDPLHNDVVLGAPGDAAQTMFDDLDAARPVRAVPVPVEGALGAATLVGGTLELAFAPADDGALTVRAAPLPDLLSWSTTTLVAGRNAPLVAGIATELVPNECTEECAGCCSDPVVFLEATRAVVQVFACGQPIVDAPEDAGFVVDPTDAGTVDDAGAADDDAGATDAGALECTDGGLCGSPP